MAPGHLHYTTLAYSQPPVKRQEVRIGEARELPKLGRHSSVAGLDRPVWLKEDPRPVMTQPHQGIIHENTSIQITCVGEYAKLSRRVVAPDAYRFQGRQGTTDATATTGTHAEKPQKRAVVAAL